MSNNADSGNAPVEQPGNTPIEKTLEELQREKAQLEINELRRVWWKRKDYLQVLLPTTLAILSLLYALTTGFFSTKYDQLQLQKEQLRLEVLTFEERREELTLSNAKLKDVNDSLLKSFKKEQQTIAKLQRVLDAKQDEVLDKEFELTQLKSRKIYYEDEIKALQVDYARRRKAFEGELTKQYISEADLSRKLEVKDSEISRLKDDIRALEHNVEVAEKNPYIQRGKKLEASIWLADEMIKYYTVEANKNDEEVKRLQKHSEELRFQSDSSRAKYKARDFDRENDFKKLKDKLKKKE